MKKTLPLFLLFVVLLMFAARTSVFAQLPPSLCPPTGGARANLLAAKAAYRAGGNSTPVTFTIPIGTATVIFYASSHQGLSTNKNDEDFISINAVLNLKTGKSSGFLNFAQNTNDDGSGTNLYGWKNVAFGSLVGADALTGHDVTPAYLNNVRFSVSGNQLTVEESKTSINTSYYVEFVSADVTSLNPTALNNFQSKVINKPALIGAGGTHSSPSTVALTAANTTMEVDIPSGANIIFITGKGTNGITDNPSPSGTEEGFSNMRFAIDVSKGTLDGFITLVNGGSSDYRSTYVINDRDITNTNPLLTSPYTAITGDYLSKSTSRGGVGVYNPKIYISGSKLYIVRDNIYANDFDDVYIFEFYTRVNQPASAEFIDNETRFISAGTNINTSLPIKIPIPAGSRFIYFNQTGNAINQNATDNENSMAAYAVIDIETGKANGFYYQQVGFNGSAQNSRRDDNFAFSGMDVLNSNVWAKDDPNTQGIFFSNVTPYDIKFKLSADKSYIEVANKVLSNVVTASQILMSLDFFGSRPDLAINTSHVSFSKGSDCKEVKIKLRIANPGSGPSPGAIPVSFYDGDPTNNPSAKRLSTDAVVFNTSLPSQQEQDFTYTLDLSAYSNLNIPITVILNDDGSFAPTLNQAIGTPFALDDLLNQSDKRIECDYNNNKFQATINVNNCPTANLDPDKSSGATQNNYIDYFTALSTGTRIADTDLSITDPDNSDLQSATITLTNRLDGNANERLFVEGGVLPGGLTYTYTAATGVLLITGNASQADYIAAIKLIRYVNDLGTPNMANRTITVALSDGVEIGPASTTTIIMLINPRISVMGNSITIADGTTTTNIADGTNFGNHGGGTGTVS